MKKLITLVILFIIVLVLVFLVINRKDDVIVDENPIDEEVEETSLLEKLEEDLNTQVVDLIAVDGSDSSGTAYRLFKDGKLYHVVTANFPDPPENNSYEGWLVQPSPLKFFSTGVMQKNKDGMWILEYETDQEYPTYLKVVITLETQVDAVPEKHVIEGSF